MREHESEKEKNERLKFPYKLALLAKLIICGGHCLYPNINFWPIVKIKAQCEPITLSLAHSVLLGEENC